MTVNIKLRVTDRNGNHHTITVAGDLKSDASLASTATHLNLYSIDSMEIDLCPNPHPVIPAISSCLPIADICSKYDEDPPKNCCDGHPSV